uniref:Uncharacterized protein LOC104245747 n=1 Tax=Nicotiana sylvestris TaxID=4096 RepID=A0A1U7Y9C2_NICSY|nr:PREDICTED: uncharacterized protein LOC104245747 [Nicotiana sylvestris]
MARLLEVNGSQLEVVPKVDVIVVGLNPISMHSQLDLRPIGYTIVVDQCEVPSMDSKPIVCEFLEVFPTDLTGMPPDRDIDFCIDLVSGLAGYYRRFIEGFSSILAPLTKLNHKDALFGWFDECELSFQKLKTALTTALAKYGHQKLGELTQRLEIPELKWENITMDFVVGLPQTLRKYDAVSVIVDQLTKSSYFILVMTSYSSKRLAQTYCYAAPS